MAEFRGRSAVTVTTTIRNTSLGPPQKGGLGDDDFDFSDNPVKAKVCPNEVTQMTIGFDR